MIKLFLTLTIVSSVGYADLSRFEPVLVKHDLEYNMTQLKKISKPVLDVSNSIQQANSKVKLEFDLSTLSQASKANTNFSNSQICSQDYKPSAMTPQGAKMLMLATALVYVAPGNRSGIFGHVGWRFLFCRENQLMDILFDSYSLGQYEVENWNKVIDTSEVGELPKEYIESLRGSYFTRKSVISGPTYTEYQILLNRSVYEMWLNISADNMLTIYRSAKKRYDDQIKTIKSKGSLSEYKLTSKNCMTDVQNEILLVYPPALKKESNAHTPNGLYEEVLGRVKLLKLVMYPSQRDLGIIQLKSQGKTTVFENIAPFSRASGGFDQGWIIIYSDTKSTIGGFFLKPLAGALNLAAAAAETAYGLVTIPLQLLSYIPGLKFLDKTEGGLDRIADGGGHILTSITEMFWLRLRYPEVHWTEDEMAFVRDANQASLILNYLDASSSF